MKKERESFLRNFIEAFTKGDIFTKLSILIFGTGYVARGQYVKAVILQIVQVLFFVFTFGFSLNYMSKLGTLGTIQREEIFDPKTLSKVVNDYDNSLMILLCGVIGIIFIFLYILLSLSNVKACYELQCLKKDGKHINTFSEDIKDLFNHKFHITLLTLPSIGILLIKVIPILFMICIAFTNYDGDHQPPTYLITATATSMTVGPIAKSVASCPIFRIWINIKKALRRLFFNPLTH